MEQVQHYWRGYNPPFFGGQYSVFSPQYDERLIKNDLLLMLNTVPGERRNRPTYGCRLRTMLFEPANDDLANEIKTEIVGSIQRNEQRVTLKTLLVTWQAQNKAYNIEITFTINNNPTQPLLIELRFSGNGITNA